MVAKGSLPRLVLVTVTYPRWTAAVLRLTPLQR